MMKEISAPDPHEVNPYALPTKRLLELCCLITCLWFIRVDGEIMVEGPVAIYA